MVDVMENLKKAVLEYDSEGAANWAKRVVEKGIDPLMALDALTEAIRQVGDGYSRGELWLPDLVGAATAMTSAMPLIEAKIKEAGKKRVSSGTIVIGTVFGDIHNIGKNMVATLASTQGFQVIDLGVDVKAEKFLEAVKEHTPDVLAMSALLTTTAAEQKKVIEALKEDGLRGKVKVAVGGGAITPEFADMIGADGYRPTAPLAVELFQKLVGQK